MQAGSGRGETAPTLHVGLGAWAAADTVEVLIGASAATCNQGPAYTCTRSLLSTDLDGTTPETYEAVRREASFEQTRAHIRKFLELRNRGSYERPLTKLQIIEIEPTAAQIEAFRKEWTVPGVDRINVKAFDSWGDQVDTISSLRAESGRSIEDHQVFVSEFMARFSEVAARNPYSWFPDFRTAEEIRTPGVGNRWVCFPYPKMMNARPKWVARR